MLVRFLFTAVSALFLLSAGSACRSLHYTFHPDGGYRQAVFPHGQLGTVRVIGRTALAGMSWTRGYGVESFDIGNPSNPKFRGGIPGAGYITSEGAFKENFAYYATTFSIQVVRIPEDPELSPEFLENIMLDFPGGSVRGLSVVRNELAAACSDGVHVFDISNPGRPVPDRVYSDVRSPFAFCLADGKLYYTEAKSRKELRVSGGQAKSFPADISRLMNYNGSLIVYLNNGSVCDRDGNELLTGVSHPRVRDGVLRYFKKTDAGKQFRILEAGKELSFILPPELEQCSSMDSDGNLFAARLANVLYFGRLEEGKVQIDSRLPLVYSEGQTEVIGGYAAGISPQGTGYFLYGFDRKRPPYEGTPYDLRYEYEAEKNASWELELMIPACAMLPVEDKFLFAPNVFLDMRHPTAPEILARTGPAANAIRRFENRVVLAQGRELSVYDVSKVPELALLRRIPPDPANKQRLFLDVALSGDTLYALGDGILTVWDIAPDKPVKLSELSFDNSVCSMLRAGSLLYLPPGVRSKDKALRIVNVMNPKKPFVQKTIPDFLKNGTYRILPYGSTFLLGDGARIRQFDISLPESPKEIRNIAGRDIGMQSYTFITLSGDTLIGKKYARFDVTDDLNTLPKEASHE